ncbi:MAG: hypothetical protein IPM40_00230 [Gammaproteobacteria bacterium]|nr:hypothetical protein [Gammaproteobacteria bacterium]
MDAVHSLRGAKTLLIVAHRLSTVERCDLRYRLESGRLVLDDRRDLALVDAENKSL